MSKPTFHCIGSACYDNCCIGWDVDIDKASYRRYTKEKNSEIAPIVERYLYVKAAYYDPEVDYASVELLDNKRCPFLNEENLCHIQKALGEQALSNVCKSYPRIYNKIDGIAECALSPSCPEAARLILYEGYSASGKGAPFYTVRHDGRKAKGALKAVKTTRQKCMDVMGDCASLVEGLNALWTEVTALDGRRSTGDIGFETLYTLGAWCTARLKSDRKLAGTRYEGYLKSEASLEMADFIECLESDAYTFVYRRYFENDFFQSVFPFTGGETYEEALRWCVVRAAIMAYQLAQHRPEDAEAVVRYVSAFSKAVDHHHAFKALAVKKSREVI